MLLTTAANLLSCFIAKMDEEHGSVEEVPKDDEETKREDDIIFKLDDDETFVKQDGSEVKPERKASLPDDHLIETMELERPVAVSSLTGSIAEPKKIRFLGPEPARSPGGLDKTQQSSSTFNMGKLDMVNDFKDHYTLSIPSSVVRFRRSHTATRVIANQNHQLLLEESVNPKTNQREILIKRMEDGNNGAVQFLRLTYTLVCAFWTGEN